MIKQNLFILTRDMIPIDVCSMDSRGCNFICPLPRGYVKIVDSKRDKLKIVAEDIINEINEKARTMKTPFENILIGYHERTPKEKNSLLKGFKIYRVNFDQRGAYGVQAGSDINSGDIYLTSDCSFYPSACFFKDLIEPSHCFCCHNIDWYWQALLTREFCIEYFNWLNKNITLQEKINDR